MMISQYKVKHLLSSPGRAKQQNMGAQSAKGDYLLILHADSYFINLNDLKSSLEMFYKMQEKNLNNILGGHFKINFITNNTRKGLFLEFLELKTTLNKVGSKIWAVEVLAGGSAS